MIQELLVKPCHSLTFGFCWALPREGSSGLRFYGKKMQKAATVLGCKFYVTLWPIQSSQQNFELQSKREPPFFCRNSCHQVSPSTRETVVTTSSPPTKQQVAQTCSSITRWIRQCLEIFPSCAQKKRVDPAGPAHNQLIFAREQLPEQERP